MTKSRKTDNTAAANIELSNVVKELEELREQLKKLRTEKKEFDEDTKSAIEDAQEEMITDDELGPCFIDEKYKEAGYFYRIVDSTRPQRVAQHLKRGYEVVNDTDIVVGDKTVSNSGSLTSAVTVELGGHLGSRTGVLMRIPLEKYNKRQEAKAKQVRETEAAMMQNMIDKSDFGAIEIGDKVFKK